MNTFVAELVGTALLILLGDGVVAGVVLSKSKAQGSGWIVITTGWALAVAIPVYAVGRVSGAHVPSLQTVRVTAAGRLEGIEEFASDREKGVEGATAIAEHLLGLLVTFIGVSLTRRLVRDAWPDASLDE